MKDFLPKLLATITGRPRYRPDVQWDKRIWVANVFRLCEYIFGRAVGIRREAATWSTIGNGQYIIHRKFYTLEAFLAYCEAVVRDRISYVPTLFFNPEINYQLGMIALDVANNGTTTGTSPLTFSHTCTGTGLQLNCGIGNTATTPTISTPIYNSVNMTIAGIAQVNAANMAAMYYLVNPGTGSNTLSIGFGGTLPNCNAVAVSYSGVQGFDASNGGTGASAASVNWNTVANNAWGAAIICAISPSTGSQTSRGGVITLSTTHQMEYQDTNGPVVTAGNVSFTWTATTWAVAGISFSFSLGQVAWLTSTIGNPLINPGLEIV